MIERSLTLRTTTITTIEEIPTSEAMTTGFFTNSMARAFRSSARRRGFARSASESTVAASWSRAGSMSFLMVSGIPIRHCVLVLQLHLMDLPALP